MPSAQQVVILACKEEAPITCWDISNGSLLTTYKQNASTRNGLCCVGRDFFAATQSSRGGLHFWAWHKDSLQQRCFAKEPLLCVASSPCGAFIAAGTANGGIFVWDVGGGHLLAEWSGHYKAITTLCYSSDGHTLLTGGDDAVVSAWLLLDVLDSSRSQTQPGKAIQPFHSWCEHTLPVTCVVMGTGGINALVASASLDRTVKLYSLTLKNVLLAVALPASLHSLALDPGQHALYAGGGDGRVFEVPLVDVDQPHSGDAAIGTGFFVLEGHSQTVTALTISPDGCLLISGSDDGTACVFEMRSRQNIRSISIPSKAPVSAALALERPAWMPTGVRNVDSSGTGRKGPERPQPLAPLVRYNTGEEPQAKWQGPTCILEGSSQGSLVATRLQMTGDPLPGSTSCPSHVVVAAGSKQLETLQEYNARLERQLREKSDELQAWKQLHGDLHEFCISQVLGGEHTAQG